MKKEWVGLLSLFMTTATAGMAPTDAVAASEREQWLRVEATRAQLEAVLGPDIQSIDYGRFQWLSIPDARRSAARLAGFKSATVTHPYALDLGGQRFDPLQSPARPQTKATRAGEAMPGWHLVQFKGPIKRAWLDKLVGSGLHPVQYIHPFTYIVWGTQDKLDDAQRSPEVRWAGELLAEYRVPLGQRGLSAQVIPTMALVHGELSPALIESTMNLRGGIVRTITRINRFLSVIHLSLAGRDYVKLASIPGVYGVQKIDTGGGLRGEMSGQAVVGGYDAEGIVVPGYPNWLSALGYDGSGVVAAVVDDEGFRSTHLDLIDNASACVVSGDATSCSRTSANGDHATHVAGAIAGTGATAVRDADGFLRGLGIAPGAALVSQDYQPFLSDNAQGGFMVADGMLDIFRDSIRSGAVIVNNSWGPTGSPQGYDIPTLQVDIVARDADPDMAQAQPLLPVWAIMNGGGDRPNGDCAPSSLGSPDEAKNVLAVGSTYLLDNQGEQRGQLFDISHNSGHGQACDGRQVPHVVAPGCNTDSTFNASDTSHAYTRGLIPFCGTSMAAPIVTGAAAIFIEKYRHEHDDATPSPALIKAAVTAAATDLVGHNNADGGVMGHRPDRFQGYGRLDLAAMADPELSVVYIDQTHVFTDTGQDWQRTIAAADPTQPIRLMLAWTDAHGHGLAGTTPAWVNDLDLLVDAEGRGYWGNAIGDDGWSTTKGSADGMNNLEGVFLNPSQHGGTIQVSVLAANIAADALDPFDPDLAAPRQDFALVCYNCIAGDAPAPTQADLGITLVATPEQVDAGEEIVFDVAVGNQGPDAIQRTHVRLTLPETILIQTVNGSLIGGSASADWNCVQGDTVDCRFIAMLGPGQSAPPLRIGARVDSAAIPGVFTVTASVDAGQNSDPGGSNDIAWTDIEIGGSETIFAHGFECQSGEPGC